jgi:hypothetical protein
MFSGISLRVVRCKSPAFLLASCLAYLSTLKKEGTCSLEQWLIYNQLHGVVPQKKELSRATAVRALNIVPHSLKR